MPESESRSERLDFLVRRDDLRQCRIADAATPDLEPGQALLKVSAFGLTSNNVTYAVFGDAMSYWNFFPAEGGWGSIPAWGFADVIASTHDDVHEGVRVYGYLPMSTHLVVTPSRVDARGFVDAAPHRSSMAAAYNGYVRVDGDLAYDRRYEDQMMLLRPLFTTSFLIDDFLDDNRFFGAGAVVLSSASSKTAISAAFLLAKRGGIEVIGLTSPGNAGFVEGLGVYDRVVTYDDVTSLPQTAAVYVDVAGNAMVREAIHRHYGDQLTHSAMVGASHWEQRGGTTESLPGPAPALFFAPSQATKRVRDWGWDRFNERLAGTWRGYVEWSHGWLKIVHGHGPRAVERAYLEVLNGRTDPSQGYVLSMS